MEIEKRFVSNEAACKEAIEVAKIPGIIYIPSTYLLLEDNDSLDQPHHSASTSFHLPEVRWVLGMSSA